MYRSVSIKESYNEKLLDGHFDEDDEVPANELSGDENGQQSILGSRIDEKKSNFVLTVATIMKTVVGAGILSLPYTISKMGYIGGLLAFLFVTFLTQHTVGLLLKSKNMARHSNYSSIMATIHNNLLGKSIASLAILLNNFGICIAQLTIMKQALRHLLTQYLDKQSSAYSAFYTSQTMFILVLALVEIPFITVSKIERLKFMAFIGVAGILVFACAMVINFLKEMSDRNWELDQGLKAFPTSLYDVASVIPNIILALCYQMNFFPILKGLRNSSDQKMSRASLVGISFCSLLYILVGNMGYVISGNSTQANFLLSLSRSYIDDWLFLLLNLSFLLSVFFSFPVMFFGARNNFIALIKLIVVGNNRQTGLTNKFDDKIDEIGSFVVAETALKRRRKARILFLAYTFILFVIILTVAILVQDIESVFNVVGAIASNSIGLIFPFYFYYRLKSKCLKNTQQKQQQRSAPQYGEMVSNKPKGWTSKLTYYTSIAGFCICIPYGLFAVASRFLKQ